jgi:hypothetical protein
VAQVASVGWTGLDGDTGTCRLCHSKEREKIIGPFDDLARRSTLTRERSDRAVANARRVVAKYRRSR